MPRRNVLLIVMDQFRADLLHGALAAHARLPNIHAFAQDAVSFTNHYTVVNPCGPSRASLLTGQYAMNHRSVRNGTPLGRDKPNLALEMRKAGYEPLLFGYTDTTADPRGLHPADPRLRSYEMPLEGFTEVLEMRLETGSLPWRASLREKGYDTPDYAHFYDPVSPDPARPARPDDPPFYGAQDSDTAFMTDRFIAEMGERKGSGWFAMLNYIRPHPPLVAPEPYNHMFDPAALPHPVRLKTPEMEEAVHPYMRFARAYQLNGSYVRGADAAVSDCSARDAQVLRALYLGLAAEVDAHLGRVIAHLKARGEYDETLIVLTSDHGEMLGDHWSWGKFHFYEPAWRIPLIIRDPGYPQHFGKRVNEITESIDLAPTLLEWCGRSAPAGMDGGSLLPFLAGKAPHHWRQSVHMELDFGQPDAPTRIQRELDIPLKQANFAILRKGRHKLVHFCAPLPPLLFDLREDPGEMRNLASDPAHAGVLLEMTQALLGHRMAHMDATLSGMRATPDGMFGHDPLG